MFPSPTGYMFFLYQFKACFIDSSKIISNFLGVLYFSWLLLTLNRLICNYIVLFNPCGLEFSVAYINFTVIALVNFSNLSYLFCLEFSSKYVDEKTYTNFSNQELQRATSNYSKK